jgi:hypothetical protein
MDILIKKYGFREGLSTKEGKITSWPYDVEEPTQSDIDLLIAKDFKIREIKALRKANLLKSTPQTITYSGNLENKIFNISDGDTNTFTTIIGDLQDDIDNGATNPTRTWGDSTGERLTLKISDFKSLRKHLIHRDAQEYDQARLKVDLINDLTTVKKVNAFDATQVIV